MSIDFEFSIIFSNFFKEVLEYGTTEQPHRPISPKYYVVLSTDLKSNDSDKLHRAYNSELKKAKLDRDEKEICKGTLKTGDEKESVEVRFFICKQPYFLYSSWNEK